MDPIGLKLEFWFDVMDLYFAVVNWFRLMEKVKADYVQFEVNVLRTFEYLFNRVVYGLPKCHIDTFDLETGLDLYGALCEFVLLGFLHLFVLTRCFTQNRLSLVLPSW